MVRSTRSSVLISETAAPRRLRRARWSAAAAASLAVLLGSGPLLGDQLVVFKNGKTLRAKTVKKEKGWLRLELDGGTMGVRSGAVAAIEEVPAGAAGGKADLLIPNQATVPVGGGGYVPPGPAYNARQGGEGGDDFQDAQSEQPVPAIQPGQPIPSPTAGIPGAQRFRSQPGANTGLRRFGQQGQIVNPVQVTPPGPRGRSRQALTGKNASDQDEDEDDDE